MTTYSPTARSALARELASPDVTVLDIAWFPGTWFPDPLSCARCGATLTAADGFVRCYSVEDWIAPDEPAQFWHRARVLCCELCATEAAYAAERLDRKRAVARGTLLTWGNTRRAR